MIDALSVAAPVAFILSACALIAAAVIFIKADVPRAYRFLRHKPHLSSSRDSVGEQIDLLTPHSEYRLTPSVGQGLAPAAHDEATCEPPTRFLPADEPEGAHVSSVGAQTSTVDAQMSPCASLPGTSPSVGAHAIFMRTPTTLSESGKEPPCLN